MLQIEQADSLIQIKIHDAKRKEEEPRGRSSSSKPAGLLLDGGSSRKGAGAFNSIFIYVVFIQNGKRGMTKKPQNSQYFA